jgi:cyclopropane-fatty-acyl-phospholipid synthase
MDIMMVGGLLAERVPLPDMMIAAGMRRLIGESHRTLRHVPGESEADFAAQMEAFSIAEHSEAANKQHYELPAEFFALILGPHRKYSSCLYLGANSLADAEDAALCETVSHAELRDGQSVLELGCGWGSLSLWMAERFPHSFITSVSNSASQRRYIEAQAQMRNLPNLKIVTSDMNDFSSDQSFDRIVSVEMFEHMANWRSLLSRARHWLKADGRLFIHVFSHESGSYRFDHNDENDWIGQHFFTGGIMPSHNLIQRFPDLFAVEKDWRWSGLHYCQTAKDWLANYDRNAKRIAKILHDVYGDDANLWRRRWRMFFLATAELFGYKNGNAWGVSHYLLKPVPPVAARETNSPRKITDA